VSIEESVIGGQGGGHGDPAGKTGKAISNRFGTSLSDPHAMAAIVVEGRAKVPAFDSMWGPSFADGRIHLHKDESAKGRKWGLIVIKGSVELSLCGQVRVDAQSPE
jgi:hypothetical protein